MAITPDTKDWTWVLRRRCPECGFEAAGHRVEELPALVHDTAMAWSEVLRRPDVAARPAPDTWSALEYACHVRDVHRIFAERLEAMLTQDTPRFTNWDQDATALEERYGEQRPETVDVELIEAAGTVAGLYAGVTDAMRDRRGLRSDGAAFTVETLGQYHLHDVVHHLHDVGADARSRTISAYDADAARYAERTAAMPDPVRAALEELVEGLTPGSRVLEIGSGGGRDAALLERLGLRVRRTDVSPGFVAFMRDQGHAADVLDPLTDDLRDPDGPYDAVWANASLLHVAHADLATVLARLAEVTRPGGLLRFSVKEGDGEAWSTHGAIAAPRHFTFWRAGALRDLVAGTGWTDVEVRSGIAAKRDETWLDVVAVRG